MYRIAFIYQLLKNDGMLPVYSVMCVNNYLKVKHHVIHEMATFIANPTITGTQTLHSKYELNKAKKNTTELEEQHNSF